MRYLKRSFILLGNWVRATAMHALLFSFSIWQQFAHYLAKCLELALLSFRFVLLFSSFTLGIPHLSFTTLDPQSMIAH
ncbi:hypothetical protein BDV40DRAFT_278598 [Aspergillus tamarii]|uniref:Uncharacterized protein n=1 Tax=Aspergillus tamarii TaxID=41984 RepID=A0A5N6UFI9_ASPTM|nr:hypothetical protein BDV40DRAFT_278598 [Aspergillus tamarii]